MAKGYNPYRNSNGRFGSGPKKKRIQYADSSERDDAEEAMSDEELKNSQIQRAEAEAQNLKSQEAQKERDREINNLKNEIAYLKERVAGAIDQDSRQFYQKMIKKDEERLQKLLSTNS